MSPDPGQRDFMKLGGGQALGGWGGWGGAPLGLVCWHCQGRDWKQSKFLLGICVCLQDQPRHKGAVPTFAEFSKQL